MRLPTPATAPPRQNSSPLRKTVRIMILRRLTAANRATHRRRAAIRIRPANRRPSGQSEHQCRTGIRRQCRRQSKRASASASEVHRRRRRGRDINRILVIGHHQHHGRFDEPCPAGRNVRHGDEPDRGNDSCRGPRDDAHHNGRIGFRQWHRAACNRSGGDRGGQPDGDVSGSPGRSRPHRAGGCPGVGRDHLRNQPDRDSDGSGESSCDVGFGYKPAGNASRHSRLPPQQRWLLRPLRWRRKPRRSRLPPQRQHRQPLHRMLRTTPVRPQRSRYRLPSLASRTPRMAAPTRRKRPTPPRLHRPWRPTYRRTTILRLPRPHIRRSIQPIPVLRTWARLRRRSPRRPPRLPQDR